MLPKRNWVGTVESSVRFNNNRSVFTAEFGGTMVTDNLYGVVTEDIKDELPDTISDETFRFNGSTQTSFDKMKLKDSVGSGIANAIFSVYNFRLVTPIPIKHTNTNFSTEVYRIPTHYVSLGNPHQKTDIGGFKVNLKTRVLQDQVGLNLELNSYSDNLNSESKQYSSTDKSLQKDLTKDTNITSATVSYMPNILPDYSPNMSIGYRIYTAENNLDKTYNYSTDSIGNTYYPDQVSMSTNTVMFSVGGTLPVALQKHRGTLSITNMSINDDRDVSDYMVSDSNNLTVLFNVNSTINPLPLVINTSFGRTGNETYYPLSDYSARSKSIPTSTWLIFQDRINGSVTNDSKPHSRSVISDHRMTRADRPTRLTTTRHRYGSRSITNSAEWHRQEA